MKRYYLFVFIHFVALRITAQISWEPFPGIFGDSDVEAITISPDGKWYLMGENDLYSSADSGKTWVPETKFGFDSDIRNLKFLSDGTPVFGTNNPTGMKIKRNGNWEQVPASNDFEIFQDTLYGIRSGHVQKSTDKGLTWTKHLQIQGTTIYRYRQHNGRHYIEYKNGVNRRYGEVTLEGIIVNWEYSELSGFEAFFIDDCDNIHFLYDDNQSVILADGTNEYHSFNYIKGKYSYYKNRIYRLTGNYLYGNLDCGTSWEYLGPFTGAKDICAIGEDTLMITFEKYVSVVRLPNLEIVHQPIENADYYSWFQEEIQDGTRFLETSAGDYRILPNGNKELLNVDLGHAIFGPSGWIYQQFPKISLKQVFSKNSGRTWDTIPKPIEVGYKDVYPLTEDILAYSSFDGTVITFSDGSVYSLPADSLNDIDHFYNSYRKIGDLIIMKGNQPPHISGFNVVTREFSPLIFEADGDSFGSVLDDEGTLFYLDESKTVLNVTAYPYTDGRSVILPSGIFEWYTGAESGCLLAHAYALYHFSKDLVMATIPLGPLEDEQFLSIRYTKSGKWIANTPSNLQGAYITNDSIPDVNQRTPVSGKIFNANVLCEQTESISSANWKFQFKNQENDFLAIGQTGNQLSFSLPTGEYDVKVIPPSYSIFEECQWPENLSVVDNVPIDDWDITSQLSFCEAGTISISSLLYRRCFESIGYVNIRNVGGSALIHPIVTLFLTPAQNIVSSPFAFITDENEYTFLLDDLSPGESLRIPFTVLTKCSVELGQELCIHATFEVQDKCDQLEYADALCMNVIGSWDPNDKQVTNDAGSEITRFNKNEYLNYKIRFQNTGTDTAFNVQLVDQLDPWLDLLTFEMISSSHDCTFQFEDGRNLVVDFKDIELPDSTTNLLASSGFFEFRIKADSAFTLFDTLFNTADIFFDFNEAVVTNTVSSQLEIETAIPRPIHIIPTFSIKPNPATEYILINYDNQTGPYIVSLFNSQGRQLSTFKVNGKQESIPVDHLLPGIYFAKIQDADFISVQKFVKVLYQQ